MDRRAFLLAPLARCISAAGRPNVAVLVADARRAAAVRGLRFRRAYAAIPETDAALASILSGRFPHAPDGERLADALARGGYRAAGAEVESGAPWFSFRVCGEEGPDPALRTLEGSDTLVVVTAPFGDGGEGSHAGARVPLVLRWPGRFVESDSDLLVSHADLMPTILAVCGVDAPPGLHGRDLSRAIVDGSGPRPESVFSLGGRGGRGEWRMVVRGLDKLVADAKMQATHLFNLGLDPLEENNLAEEPAHARLRDEMTAHLADWMRRIGYGIDPSGLKLRG